MGGRSRKRSNKSSGRGSRPGDHGLFVEGRKGGDQDSIPRSGSGRRTEGHRIRSWNAIGYMYPQETAFIDGGKNLDKTITAPNPILLGDSEKSPIVVYLDEGSVKKSQNVECMYDYTTSFTLGESSHRGLGFYDEGETTSTGIECSSKTEEQEGYSMGVSSSGEGYTDVEIYHYQDEAVEDLMAGMSFTEENQGYLLIGGRKIYTQDISDEDEDGYLSEEASSGSSGSEDCSETSEIGGSSYSGSDIDDEVAVDYFEGRGGLNFNISVDRLVGQVPYDDIDSEDSLDGTLNKLGGIDLQEASMEYGMKNPELLRKYTRDDKISTPVKHAYPSPLDDIIRITDPRTYFGKKKKKHVSRLPQSWPSEGRKSKCLRKIPGEKMRHSKEMIAANCRDIMVRRGVDLQKINLKLKKIVLDGKDMQSFPPMHPRDCSQVRTLAAMYGLHSSCQGSGTKRFVTVIQTQRTCMPSTSDKIRLEKLIAANKDADLSVVDGKPKPMKVGAHAVNSTSRVGSSTPVGSQSFRKKSSKNSVTYKSSTEAKHIKTGKEGTYAAQPVSFVSSGILNTKVVEINSNVERGTFRVNKLEVNAAECVAFEMHTTGFGSKMLSKMGYVQGGGLGKDGQGMAQPIEVSQRPKSLGLGAEVSETTERSINTRPQHKSLGRKANSSGVDGKSEINESQKLGSFEKHTVGFGSKVMAKMGFVDGTGLGKDSQGIVNPLAAVRRPKSMGLGANR